MKYPLKWLRELVDVQAPAEELAERLTFSGVEVEGIDTVGGTLDGVVVGQILSVEKHPGADKLKICRVSDGKVEYRVVCGAPNGQAGDKVPFAKIGAVLPDGTKIKEAKLRGELSQGMLCAEDELGISEDHGGLMILPADTQVGASVAELLGLPDTVLDLEIVWNRPDCLSMVGIAREIAALYGKKVKLPDVSFEEKGEPVESLVSADILDPALCPRYTARVIDQLKQGPSPIWMQRRLAMCGVRPINNLVDITNYVMLELGFPQHAFDYAYLRGRKIIVRRAKTGEVMNTLDGQERKLNDKMLVIADAERAVALAGVMGGAGSEIVASTSRMLLETASFDPVSTRYTSSTLGLATESSYRFERGVDAEGLDFASRRACALLARWAGGIVSRGVVDQYPGRKPARVITCRYGKVRSLIGVPVPDETVRNILSSLECRVTAGSSADCKVEVPSFRRDLEIEADLIEEVARMNGLDKVPDQLPGSRVVSQADDKPSLAREMCKDRLAGLGLMEVMHYSFLAKAQVDVFGSDEETRVYLPNPVSSDFSVLRNSLVPQMADCLGRNLSRQVRDAAFYEVGKVYLREGGVLREEERLCIGVMGRVGRDTLLKRKALQADEVYLWLKGVLDALGKSLHAGAIECKPIQLPYCEAGRAVSISIGGIECGAAGMLSEGVRHRWRMTEPVAVAEIAIAPLLAGAFRTGEFKPLPQYPSISRDVAMLVGESLTHEKIVSVIQKIAPPELTGIELFDIFKGKGMGDGRKSVAYSLTYRSFERTLTDEEANKLHDSIKNALKKELSAEIREG